MERKREREEIYNPTLSFSASIVKRAAACRILQHRSMHKQQPGKNLSRAHLNWARHSAGLPRRGAESSRPSPYTQTQPCPLQPEGICPLASMARSNLGEQHFLPPYSGHTICALLLQYRAEGCRDISWTSAKRTQGLLFNLLLEQPTLSL